MQVKKILGIALAAALVESVAVVAMPTVSAAGLDPAEHTFGVIGGFNDWSGDVAMSDTDGDGVYEAEVDVAGSYEFKVRADGAWDYSWGEYEVDYDRTQNSQTNCNVTVGEGQKLIVKLDTTIVSPAAMNNAESAVNEDGFDFAADGFEYWPVTFEVVDSEVEQFIPFTTLGVIGGFNEWGGDVAMTDEDGDGVYEAEIDVVGSYEFKVRADGAWDYSWGEYEVDYDRTQNSQTNCTATVEEGQKLIVKLDTTIVSPAAMNNAESAVNEDGFNFAADGYDFWPVTFEVVDGTTEPDVEPDSEPLGDVTQRDDYIYFDNSYTKWDSVYAYWWESGYGRTYDLEDNDYGWVAEVDEEGNPANHPVAFPGLEMTQIPGTDVWQARVPFGAQNIIFSSGKTDDEVKAGEIGYQTADLKFDATENAGQIYVVTEGSEPKKGKGVEKTKFKYNEGAWEDYTGEYVPEELKKEDPTVDPDPTPVENKTVLTDYIYFDNGYTQWDEVYAYWWDSSYGRTYDLEDNDYGWVAELNEDGTPNNHPIAFPGTKMTQVPGTNVWQARIPFGAQNIIFSSGKTDDQIKAGEIGYQTGDLSFDSVANAGQIYVVVEGSEPKKGKGVEKTKFKYNEGAWVDYNGEFVAEVLASDTPVTPDPSQPDSGKPGTDTPTPGTDPVKTGDAAMPIAVATIAIAALGIVIFASKKKSAVK